MRRVTRIVGRAMAATSLTVVIALGQSTPNNEQAKALTPEGSLNLRTVADLQFSADGSRLALVVTESAKGTGRLRHIWIYDAGRGVARQITFSGKSELAPRW